MHSAIQRFVFKNIKGNSKPTAIQTKEERFHTISQIPQEKHSKKSKKSCESVFRKRKSLPVQLPSLFAKFKQNKKKSQLLSHSKKRLVGSKMEMPVRLTKNSISNSCRRMGSAATKPTDKYLNEVNNIRFVERLLLIKPSESIRKESHNEFYKKQKEYKKNIQISKSMWLGRKSFCNEKEWQ